ncbi:uncharacterized protein LOC128175479 [Crassostrea angulata]|uniref:uncharacterized protein LOC128175479 n=1 Tax=Magallana angulata TaxID=2784310 RepID=UPI0022B12ABF|nr:uncharacterized protein LOC128175479 [Crassostrea angulata]
MNYGVILIVLTLVSTNLVHGQSYRPNGYAGSNYAGGRPSGRYTQGGRCPAQACTLQLIPPECRQRQFFAYNGRMCPGCDVDICTGVNTGVGAQFNNFPSNSLPLGF